MMLSEIFKDLLDFPITDEKVNTTEILKEENNENNIPQVTLNGEPIDLSKPENVQKAYDFIDMFAKSPIIKLFMDEEDINNICDAAKKNIEAIHVELTSDVGDPDADDDPDPGPDDVEVNDFIVTQYLVETVENWEDVPEERRKRSVRALTDFMNWLDKLKK